MKIAIDCLGGDRSPDANVEGALQALAQFGDLEVVLLGDEKEIASRLAGKNAPEGRITIVHAPDVVTGEDRPMDAVRLKKDSSMMRGIRMLREDASVQALVSCGATGALVAAATVRIGRIKGVRRPAFCPIIPAMDGSIVGVCDSGANVECSAEMLQQFAVMGSAYLSCTYGVQEPKTALLNVGVESEKGDDAHREAYRLLQNTKGVNFVGNMESRDLLSGKYSLVVCDGFSGNVLVKATEGTALEMLKKLKKDIGSRFRYKIGALFMKKMFLEEKESMNYQNYGGSVLLGCDKVIVKGHGSSKATAVEKCVEQAYRMIRGNMIETISERIAENIETTQEKEKSNV